MFCFLGHHVFHIEHVMSLSLYSHGYREMVINGTLKFRKQQVILSNIKVNKASLEGGGEGRIVFFKAVFFELGEQE